MKQRKFIPVIEDGVPVPGKRHEDSFSHGLRMLKIDQSMWFPAPADSMRAIARKIFGKGGYIARTESKDLQAGCRIWRVK